MKKLQTLFGILALSTVMILPLIYQSGPSEILKLRTFDYFAPKFEPSGYFTILNITEEDLEIEGGWPLPRSRLAEIHIDLLNAGASGVGYVISFPQPDRMGGDNDFATALGYVPTVIAMFENDNGIYPKTSGTVIMGEYTGGILTKGIVQNTQVLRDASVQAIATAPTEIDQIVRRIPLLLRTPDGYVSAFGTEVLKILANTDTYIIKTNELGIQEITVQGLPPIPTDSFGRKWISWVDTPEITLSEMENGVGDINGKYVFVGVTAGGIMPQIATPIGLEYPHKIQASLAESILIQDSPYIPDYSLSVEILTVLISVILVWLIIGNMNVTVGVLLVSLIMIGTGVYGVNTIKGGVLIDFTWTVLTQFITASISFYLRFREQWKLRKQIKGQFGTYLSPEMVDMLVKDPTLMKLGGERKEMTFLFADIVGFTPISEKYMKNNDPEGLVDLINHFLNEITKVILKNGGTIDKYMGDCVMAFWGAPLPCNNHQEMAIKTAMEIEILTEKMNAELEDLPPVVIGTGINTGPCIVGNMGSETRFDYSVVGDAVNLAARLEVQTRTYDTPILISEYTFAKGNTFCEKIDEIKVKGKEIPVTIYAPIFEDGIRKLQKIP